jgi:hypothetical protein
MDETTDPAEIIAQLTEARNRKLTVYIDNDHIGAYDDDRDEDVLSVHPHDLMLALLLHFGLKAEPV